MSISRFAASRGCTVVLPTLYASRGSCREVWIGRVVESGSVDHYQVRNSISASRLRPPRSELANGTSPVAPLWLDRIAQTAAIDPIASNPITPLVHATVDFAVFREYARISCLTQRG